MIHLAPDPAAAPLEAELRAALRSGRLELPLPGAGDTVSRWAALSAYAERDLSLGRLAEAHTDAVAVLSELGGPRPDGLLGLWAAESAAGGLEARRSAAGWSLTGRKDWCSGAALVDRALVTARALDGRRLFLVERSGLRVVSGTWQATGMAGSASGSVELDGAPGLAVGGVDAYLTRPGFWHGAAGVAACWYGGARGVGRTLLARARAGGLDPHGLAHLGAVDAVLAGLAQELRAAAQAVDADPGDRAGGARRGAQVLRARVEAGAGEVLDRVGRALGAAPLCLDAAHGRRVADLQVYLRQSHAERDLAELGRLAVQGADW